MERKKVKETAISDRELKEKEEEKIWQKKRARETTVTVLDNCSQISFCHPHSLDGGEVSSLTCPPSLQQND